MNILDRMRSLIKRPRQRGHPPAGIKRRRIDKEITPKMLIKRKRTGQYGRYDKWMTKTLRENYYEPVGNKEGTYKYKPTGEIVKLPSFLKLSLPIVKRRGPALREFQHFAKTIGLAKRRPRKLKSHDYMEKPRKHVNMALGTRRRRAIGRAKVKSRRRR